MAPPCGQAPVLGDIGEQGASSRFGLGPRRPRSGPRRNSDEPLVAKSSGGSIEPGNLVDSGARSPGFCSVLRYRLESISRGLGASGHGRLGELNFGSGAEAPFEGRARRGHPPGPPDRRHAHLPSPKEKSYANPAPAKGQPRGRRRTGGPPVRLCCQHYWFILMKYIKISFKSVATREINPFAP